MAEVIVSTAVRRRAGAGRWIAPRGSGRTGSILSVPGTGSLGAKPPDTGGRASLDMTVALVVVKDESLDETDSW